MFGYVKRGITLRAKIKKNRESFALQVSLLIVVNVRKKKFRESQVTREGTTWWAWRTSFRPLDMVAMFNAGLFPYTNVFMSLLEFAYPSSLKKNIKVSSAVRLFLCWPVSNYPHYTYREDYRWIIELYTPLLNIKRRYKRRFRSQTSDVPSCVTEFCLCYWQWNVDEYLLGWSFISFDKKAFGRLMGN